MNEGQKGLEQKVLSTGLCSACGACLPPTSLSAKEQGDPADSYLVLPKGLSEKILSSSEEIKS